MAWWYLLAAGLLEVGFTTCLKLSDGFTKLWPSVGFVVCSIASFAMLNVAVKVIPLGTAYAVWTGIGAFGTAVIGMVFFHDPVGAVRIILLLNLVSSVVGLKLISPS